MISKSKNNINSVLVLGSSSEIAKEICIELAHKGCKRFHLLARDLDKNNELIDILKAKKINNILFELVDILLVNEIESQQLLEISSDNFKEQAKKLSTLVSKTIITLGDKGIAFCEKNKKPNYLKAHSVKVKSAHGAGDHFAGKFVSNFIRTNNFEDSIKIANKKTSEFISS